MPYRDGISHFGCIWNAIWKVLSNTRQVQSAFNLKDVTVQKGIDFVLCLHQTIRSSTPSHSRPIYLGWLIVQMNMFIFYCFNLSYRTECSINARNRLKIKIFAIKVHSNVILYFSLKRAFQSKRKIFFSPFALSKTVTNTKQKRSG